MILAGVLGSLGAGLMTGVGALPVLGVAAGVMISASFFSLLLPGIERGEAIHGGTPGAALVAALGLACGAAVVAAMNALVPHEHFVTGPEGGDPGRLSKVWLFILAITIHNFPEGMAVGVGFGSGDMAQGMSLAIGIGLQNAPEGLAVALALRVEGYGAARAVGIAALTGLVEPLGGLIGAAAVTLTAVVLPFGLTFAAGAMLYIISHEIIPETHRHGHQDRATLGLMIGLILMMLLDVTLG